MDVLNRAVNDAKSVEDDLISDESRIRVELYDKIESLKQQLATANTLINAQNERLDNLTILYMEDEAKFENIMIELSKISEKLNKK